MEFIFKTLWDIVLSILIGIIVGFVGSLITKLNRSMKSNEILETATILLIGLSSFDICEIFHLSGPISVVVTAITLKNYAWFNLSEKG